jgi:hypothetical protein
MNQLRLAMGLFCLVHRFVGGNGQQLMLSFAAQLRQFVSNVQTRTGIISLAEIVKNKTVKGFLKERNLASIVVA